MDQIDEWTKWTVQMDKTYGQRMDKYGQETLFCAVSPRPLFYGVLT